MEGKPELDGKVAVITGGASGIGLSTARLFARKGATLVLLDLDERVGAIAADLSPQAMGLCVDITDSEQIAKAVDRITERFGRIDILCNIAGFGHSSPPEEILEEDWNKVLNVNLTALFFVSQKIGRQMIRQGSGGKIVNMASQAGVVAIPNHAAYSVSKAGVIALSRALALDWGRYGINVNSLSPTVVLTPMAKDYWVGERADRHLAQIPSGRFATPEEVASAVLYLAGPASDMVNGTNLVLDGGFTSTRC